MTTASGKIPDAAKAWQWVCLVCDQRFDGDARDAGAYTELTLPEEAIAHARNAHPRSKGKTIGITHSGNIPES